LGSSPLAPARPRHTLSSAFHTCHGHCSLTQSNRFQLPCAQQASWGDACFSL
jgi:hypothetical protein